LNIIRHIFRFLVAVTECYFPESYYDRSLTGAQADQLILNEIAKQKLPLLMEHLKLCDVELPVITLTWFITLFYNSVPFETMLRIWDCFLLEGPKVLYRFSLAFLDAFQKTVLNITDNISIINVFKKTLEVTYDADTIVQVRCCRRLYYMNTLLLL
uniref:Rab-GAP TBC domain-containing protein n=1 Tax=Soboliphyme baturini TaxID=241478 RepID=A0A183J3V0_9BILA